ncbi:SulP family inorganic anion transporter [Vibrio sp. DW001]|uniref:SulP family inorganic anion transporter n=1 Tax=Vibrio sp. DW001 TaxID=2912315 RepID=UPI0023B03182|nr:SulP family inorganic anion transporter [Vibrio sp. DW001]WED29136.1 SulP family inorganic anion transporter [Vibrio sp. DW001]
MIALKEAYTAGLLKQKYWLNNVLSGVIVGVVALPLAMAFAIASGAKPEQGIYTAIVAGFCVSIFGGSRLQIAGPTGAFIVILSGITGEHGVIGLQIATFMAGIILFIFGLTKMGSIIKFIPAPVIVGFTAGIGVIIWIGQWRDFFGLPVVTGEHFHQKFAHLIELLPQFHPSTTMFGIVSLFILLICPKLRWTKKIPGPLIALVLMTSLQAMFQFEGIKTIGSAFGGIPLGLPTFEPLSFEWSQVITLIGPAFAIAMLGAIESLLSAVVADGMVGTKHNSNQELVGQGIANIVAPLFGGFAATGAIARTATNIRNGGNSPLAGIVHAITLCVVLLVLAPLADNIPLATLAAILFVVAWNMSEAKHFVKMMRTAPHADVAVLIITFTLTIFADLVVAVNIGVILATLHFLHRMASSVEVSLQSSDQLNDEQVLAGELPLPKDTVVYNVDGPFFFGAVDSLDRTLAETLTTPEYLVIRLKWVPFIDITGIEALDKVIRELQNRGIRVMVCGANTRVEKKLKKAGVLDLVGVYYYFATFDSAVNAIRERQID